MSESSARSKSPSLSKLIAFAEVVQSTDSELRRLAHIRRKYENIATDFDICLDYCKLLGFVEANNGIITPVGAFEKLLTDKKDIDPQQLKELVVDSTLSERTNSVFLDEFFALFNRIDGSLTLHLSLDERLKYSDIRNLFLELGIIKYNIVTDNYEVERELAQRFLKVSETAKKKVLSDDQLLLELEKQRELGAQAELLVIDYERKRLVSEPELVDKIEHIAKKNVGAGYDILSWELDTKNQRYIEVKAVPRETFRFYWSDNEIEKASEYEGCYFLYLLPAVSPGKVSMDDAEIIQDPYNNVFLNSGYWTKKERLYTIWKNNGN